MNEIRQEETQQELFGEFSPQPKSPERFPTLARSQKIILLNVTIEQIILASIMLVLLMCFVFFLGLLRGKAVAGMAKPAPISPRVVQSATSPSIRVTTPQTLAHTTTLKPKADPSKPYTIQLVTYKRQDLAEQDVAYLRSKGYYATIIPSGDYFQVCAGQYASKEEAKLDIKRFQARYKDVFLRRR